MTTNVQPQIAFDFTSATISPLIAFARSGATATRVNASGLIETVAADVARFDFDPTTLACRGLFVEEARQNQLTYSQTLTDVSWSTSSATSVAVSAKLSPDGVSYGYKYVPNAVATIHDIFKTISATANTAYTSSCFFEKGDYRYAFLSVNQRNSGAFVGQVIYIVDLETGSVGSAITNGTAPTSTSAKVETYKDGWYRLCVTGTTAANVNQVRFNAGPAANLSSASMTGDASKGINIWGAQLEIGGFATSYILTTTAALTRNADVATIAGTNFSDWWQASKGGVLVRARPSTVSGTRPWVQFDDGTANEIIALRGNATNPELYIVDGGTPQAQIDAGTIAANTDYSLTGWWATNDCKARLDSGAVVTDTSATIPTVTQARLGSDGTNYLNGHLASISYYDSFSEQIYTRRKNKAVFNLM